MLGSKLGAAVFLFCALLSALVPPMLAVEYNHGVLVGQYVKYGNFVVTPSLFQFEWAKAEVIALSGKEVTLRISGQLNIGAAIPGSGSILTYNIETGMSNGPIDQSTYWNLSVIIAGNLNAGDSIPPLSSGYIVNKTETRPYLGVSRTINILEAKYSDANYDNQWTLAYDKVSGMLLESEIKITQKNPTPITTKISFGVTETNIFAAIPEFPSSLIPPVYMFAMLTALTISLVYRRKHRSFQ